MFFVKPVNQVIIETKEIISPVQEVEVVSCLEGLGRVLAVDINSNEDIPGFNRSTVDGYAVKAADTFGASENMPGFLEVVDEVMMGQAAEGLLVSGEAQRVATGGMLPEASDAVVMQEYTEVVDSTLTIYRAVSPGENVIRKGEDITEHQAVYKAGHVIEAQDIGLLAAMGVNNVEVYRRLKVAVFSSGDEIESITTGKLALGKIRDTNGYSLTAFFNRNNCDASYHGIVRDDYQKMYNKVHELYNEHDVVVVSGGSSVGTKDITSKIIETLPDAALIVHGIAIKPGKPTIIANSRGKLILGLPGHPVSALIVLQHVVLPIIEHLQAKKQRLYNASVQAFLVQNIDSQTGRTDIIRVALSTIEKEKRILATPILGKAGVFSSVINADGYIVIPENSEGISKDCQVEVFLFR